MCRGAILLGDCFLGAEGGDSRPAGGVEQGGVTGDELLTAPPVPPATGS